VLLPVQAGLTKFNIQGSPPGVEVMSWAVPRAYL
jgi:hypothetical protein